MQDLKTIDQAPSGGVAQWRLTAPREPRTPLAGMSRRKDKYKTGQKTKVRDKIIKIPLCLHHWCSRHRRTASILQGWEGAFFLFGDGYDMVDAH